MFLAVTDHQDLTPLLAATASSNDVIESDVMFRDVLSDVHDEIGTNEKNKVKAQTRFKLHQADGINDFTDETQIEQLELMEYIFLERSSSCDHWRPKCHSQTND